MSQDILNYEIGDWIVHRHHGIGQIVGTRTSPISGELTTYYEVQTLDSTVWIPVDLLTEDILRPILTLQELEEVLTVLQRPPRVMEPRFSERKTRIYRVQKHGMPIAMARLVRDLRARQEKQGRLSNTEQDALRSVTRKLLQEWSVCKGISVEKAQERLNGLLQRAFSERRESVPAPLTSGMMGQPAVVLKE